MKIPASVRLEHDALHKSLADVSLEAGRVGEAARTVARLMHPHFVREDEYAMPPLGLLTRLAQDDVSPDMVDALPLIARLKAEMPLMLEEHRGIKGALQKLEELAGAEGKPDIAELARRLRLHAELEEDVLYPAAIVVGEYLRLKLPAAVKEVGR